MSNRLEKFIRDHRDEFDSEEPGKKVWENIGIPPSQAVKSRPSVFRLYAVRLSAAAAILLLVAGGTWYFIIQHSKGTGRMAMNTPSDTAFRNTPSQQDPNGTPARPDQNSTPGTEQVPGTNQTPGNNPASGRRDSTALPSFRETGQPVAGIKGQSKRDTHSEQGADDESDFREEMYHYAKLVELKHKELKHIEKGEPLLYQQFAGDVNKLDSVYHSLERKLPTNPNREQLLEAMLHNLQLQMELLNHQLKIIRQINHSKKTAYENAYKTT
ncbi:MAG: hypothetical protein P4L51_00640 [Puia sp.]|nr:hypothetical protein [Puia sp.]